MLELQEAMALKAMLPGEDKPAAVGDLVHAEQIADVNGRAHVALTSRTFVRSRCQGILDARAMRHSSRMPMQHFHHRCIGQMDDLCLHAKQGYHAGRADGTKLPDAERRCFMKLFLSSFLLCLIGAVSLGCEPEVGEPCGPSEEFVNSTVRQTGGTNDLVLDPRFENCTQALCLSTDGSRPYCTRTCTSDADCQADGFICDQVIKFGSLACADFTPEHDCFQEDDVTPSTAPITYCAAASPDVITKRDQDFGRATK